MQPTIVLPWTTTGCFFLHQKYSFFQVCVGSADTVSCTIICLYACVNMVLMMYQIIIEEALNLFVKCNRNISVSSWQQMKMKMKMLQLNTVTIVGTFCVLIFFLFRVALITPKRIPNWIKTTTSDGKKAELLCVVLIMSL